MPKYEPHATIVQQIDAAFSFSPVRDGQPERYDAIRNRAKDLARAIAGEAPPSRELSLALTKLEECVFWSLAAVARNER